MIFEKLFSKENKKDEIVDVKLSDKKFNELRIKLSIGDVTVEQGEIFSVNFTGKRHYLPLIRLEDGKLRLKQKMNLIEKGEAHLKVVIPAKATLDSLDIQTSSGDIEIVDIKTEKAYLKSTEGRVRVRRVAIAESLLESTDGNVTVRNSDLADGKLATYDGEIKVSGSILSRISLNVTDGDMNLTDVTIDEGSANLKAGNFTLDHAVFKSDYEIKNIEGNNTVWSANLKYTHVGTANGLNNILFDPQPSGVVLTMTTVDGDNVVE